MPHRGVGSLFPTLVGIQADLMRLGIGIAAFGIPRPHVGAGRACGGNTRPGQCSHLPAASPAHVNDTSGVTAGRAATMFRHHACADQLRYRPGHRVAGPLSSGAR